MAYRTGLTVYVIFFYFLYKSIFCGYSFELHRQVDAIQMGTNNICMYKEVDKMYIVYNLKTTKSLYCALIGVCSVIRSNYKERQCNSFLYKISFPYLY